jgi:hypothetical protein
MLARPSVLKPMRILLIAFMMAIPGLGLSAQAASTGPVAGMAGHPDCRTFFAVMWLDGVPEGKTQQATHYGLNQHQLDWWMQEGRSRNKNLCYVSGLQELQGKLQVDCSGCGGDWTKRFRWLVFEHTQEKQKRVSESMGTVMMEGQSSARPSAPLSGGVPSTRVDYEVPVIATGVAIFPAADPLRPPGEQDRQLFYYSAEKDKAGKDIDRQVARNDRAAFQAAAGFVAKETRR